MSIYPNNLSGPVLSQPVFMFVLLAILTPLASAEPRGAEPLPRDGLYRTVYALCVGIDDYRSTGISDLSYCEADARALAELLRAEYGYEAATLLGQAASRSALLRKLDEYEELLGPDDALVLFLAGHGQTVEKEDYGREGFFVPQDAALRLEDTLDLIRWREESISLSELGERMIRLRARHVLVVADICYSGFLGRRAARPNRQVIEQLVSFPSRVAITAGTEGQTAIEDAALGHGVFSSALLELLGRGEPQTAGMLFQELRQEVAARTQSAMLPQYRELVVGNGEFVFFPRTDEGAVQKLLADFNLQLNARTARFTTEEEYFLAAASSSPDATATPERSARVWRARVARFRDNAALGDPLALASLYYCSVKGLGVEQDDQEAYRLARRAFESGHREGKQILGRSFLYGVGVEKNLLAASDLLRAAADEGSAVAPFNLYLSRFGQYHSKEVLSPQQRDQAYALLKQAADRGFPPAMGHLGMAHTEGWLGRDPDPAAGIPLLEKAAAKDDLAGLFGLSKALYRGYEDLLPQDSAKGAETLEKAARLGHASAQAWLARFYSEEGQDSGIALDYTMAMMWAALAARNDEPDGLMVQFRLHMDGLGTPQNRAHALALLQQACDRDYAPALRLLGAHYADGLHVPRDVAKAEQLLTRAAALKDAVACRIIAQMYRAMLLQPPLAQGVTNADLKFQTWAHALHWDVQAAELGNEEGLQSIRNVCARLSSDDVLGRASAAQLLFELRQVFPDSAAVIDRHRAEYEKGETG